MPEVLDAFNARDFERLTGLLLESGSAQISGFAPEFGRGAITDRETGSLFHTVFSPLSHAVLPELLLGNRDNPRGELRVVHGELVMVIWYDHDDGPVVRGVVRILYHFFSPDVLGEVCSELGVPWRTNGYRYPGG